MFDEDKWQEIFNTIRKHKLRTALTALGVFWGIFMLVFIMGMGKGLENGVNKTFGRTVKNVMYMNSFPTTKPYKGFSAGRWVPLSQDDVEAIKSNIPELDKIAPRRDLANILVERNDNSDRFVLRGELTDMIQLDAIKQDEGRYINQLDLNNNRKVVVIGDYVRKLLFEDEPCIGKFIKISGIKFRVVGVFSPTQVNVWSQSHSEAVVIPFTTMSKTFGIGQQIDWFICSAKLGMPVSLMETKIKTFLKKRHKIAPDDPEGFRGFNLENQFNEISSLFLGIKLFLWIVGIGTLMAGIVGVSNIMIIIVKERTKEIGIRKALGASPFSIIEMILTESVFITAFSGYLGLIAGTFIIGLIDFIMVSNKIEPANFWHPEVSVFIGLGALAILIISGLIAGLIPAMNAARINPVVALRSE